ncbi:MAG: class I SAM-dependent methyltransferase [Mycobacteriales bacterium]|nr:class I SAM-dependent methyltransferase [Mycobacteriales bacterium]
MVGHPPGLAEGRALQAAPLTPAAARLLLSDAGRAAVAQAVASDLTDAARVTTATALGTALGPELGPLALEQALLRRRAVAKHPRGGELWWTAEALEQASSYTVADHRVGRFAGPVVDLCCGVGGDLLPLASAHGSAVGVDLDEARLLLAAANARVLGLDVALARADVTRLALPPDARVFVDPARRSGRARVFDPRLYSPRLDEVLTWRVRELGVKVAPGIDYDALPADVEVELVSLRGDVKEAVLWGGEARRGVARTATLLPSGDALSSSAAPVPAVRPPGRWLLEPDGAVVRAHLVAELAERVGGWLLDATIAYVAADEPVATPFGRWYEVLEVMPFSLKRLRARLRELDAGTLVVKKRGTAVEPEQLRRQLRLTGSVETTVVLTRSAGAQVVLVVRPA